MTKLLLYFWVINVNKKYTKISFITKNYLFTRMFNSALINTFSSFKMYIVLFLQQLKTIITANEIHN